MSFDRNRGSVPAWLLTIARTRAIDIKRARTRQTGREDTFGCTPKFLADNPKAAQALTNSYFEALEMIKSDPKKSYEIMGADVKQTGAEFESSAKYLRWQDKAANQKFFTGELQEFSKEAAALLTELGIIKKTPDTNTIVDTSFIK